MVNNVASHGCAHVPRVIVEVNSLLEGREAQASAAPHHPLLPRDIPAILCVASTYDLFHLSRPF